MGDPKMERAFRLGKVEELIVRDEKFLCTIVSLVMVLVVSLNSAFILSTAIGITTSLIYFLINTVFLERALFQNETPFTRLLLGSLFLLLLLGIIGWATLTIYKLDVAAIATVLCIVTGLSSTMNRIKTKHKARELE